MRSHRAPTRVDPSGEGATDLHSLSGGAGSGGSGVGHGPDCVCPEVHGADTVQRKDTDQQSRRSVSIQPTSRLSSGSLGFMSKNLTRIHLTHVFIIFIPQRVGDIVSSVHAS